MQIDLDTLPDDPATLQQMLRTVLHRQGMLHAENDKLRLLIQRLTRHQFGRRSEQLTPDQLQLGLEALEQAIAANQAAEDAAADAVAASKRQPRPAHPPSTGIPRATHAEPWPVPPATTVPCQRTCRAMRWWWTSRTATVPAVARR